MFVRRRLYAPAEIVGRVEQSLLGRLILVVWHGFSVNVVDDVAVDSLTSHRRLEHPARGQSASPEASLSAAGGTEATKGTDDRFCARPWVQVSVQLRRL